MDVSPFAAILLVALLSLLFFVTTRKPSDSDGRRRRRLPPSPPGLPLLGHLPLLGPLPHRKLQAMAASHGPVMLLRLGRVPTVVASSAAAAQEVMKTRDLAFASRPRVRMAERLLYGRDVAFSPYGERWRQARRVSVLHLLSHRRVLSLRAAREQEAAAMVDRVRRASGGGLGGTVVNMNAAFISYTNGVISRAVFGGGGGDGGSSAYGLDGEKLAKLFADFEGLLGTVTMGEFVPWLAWVDKLTGLDARTTRMSQEMDALVDRVIADHRQRRRRGRREGDDDEDHRDFVDVLLDLNDEEADKTGGGGGVMFDDVAIKAMVLVMFAAGTDTTYTALVWAMAELIDHPHEMRRVQDESRAAVGDGDGDGGGGVTDEHLDKLRYLKCVIKETLRLHAPLPLLLPHETTQDTELLGFHVPARTRVIVNAWAVARDPAAWDRAGEFVPERFAGDELKADDYGFAQDFRLVPFGAGRRGCPAVGFALPSMELALASLLYHFDWELPAGGGSSSKLEMDELNGLSVRLRATLLLVAKPWSP